MITSTHAVVSAAVAAYARRRGSGILRSAATRRWFVAGGVAPDLPGLALAVGAAIYYPLVRHMTRRDTFEYVTQDRYFNSPIWIVGHNSLHSPILLLAAWQATRRLEGQPASAALAFITGAALHAAMDIPVHHDDGPLVLFPLNWRYRVRSPISYWNPAHGGPWLRRIDLATSMLGAGLFVARLCKQRRLRVSLLPSKS